MPAEESIPQTIPVITFQLVDAGWPLLAFGLVVSIWGLWNLFREYSPTSVLCQSLLSLLPAVIAIVGVYFACSDFVEMAQSDSLPKPAQFSGVANRGMSFGFCGLLTTTFPVLLGLTALGKTRVTRP